MPRRALALVLTALGALSATAAATAGSGGFLPPAAHSPNAGGATDIYLFVLGFAAAAFAIVEGALVTFAIRYRRGQRARTAEGPQVRGSARLQLMWTAAPALAIVAIAVFTGLKLSGITSAPAANAANATTITVEGRQFYWLFRYPNGAVSVGTMVAPANELVRETVVSADDDVIHSWLVPGLGAQTEAIPGHTGHGWFDAPEGTYVARCAELCGVQHTLMTARVEVVPPADYARFIAARKAGERGAALGKEEFDGACATCHQLNTPFIGPALAGQAALTDPAGMATLVRNGYGKMSAVGSDWTDAQIDALVAYTKTLGSNH